MISGLTSDTSSTSPVRVATPSNTSSKFVCQFKEISSITLQNNTCLVHHMPTYTCTTNNGVQTRLTLSGLEAPVTSSSTALASPSEAGSNPPPTCPCGLSPFDVKKTKKIIDSGSSKFNHYYLWEVGYSCHPSITHHSPTKRSKLPCS